MSEPQTETKQSPNPPAYLSTSTLLWFSLLVRFLFLLYSFYQDTYLPVKYTDIDYLVFTDASRYVSQSFTPYLRETYRYTPLLSWLLLPNVTWFESWGKILFVIFDLITGWVIIKILRLMKVKEAQAVRLSSIWLLNPMVITISTRGSSESVLTVFVISFIFHLIQGDHIGAGVLAGVAVHLKIYPVIYIPTCLLFLVDYTKPCELVCNPLKLINSKTLKFGLGAAASFLTLSSAMYYIYGWEFVEHTYLYHLTRTDHRHNFSIYNMSLYFTSSLSSTNSFEAAQSSYPIVNHLLSTDLSKLAFVPQLALSSVVIPLVYTKRSLSHTLFLQTLIFVSYNKVMTSQYFIWFLIFLPMILSRSSLITTMRAKGIAMLLFWILGQAAWLSQGYNLEFLGQACYYPGLISASVAFFASNIYVAMGIIDSVDGLSSNDGL
ncbi:hypothetical protein WICPIJ_007688 [Wickerhamomyces pijperi]|uniref:GPI mannosyltransferase 1 n=1 Tax=Wickerhamomyces pijperi TaxID=599730 RepID=A0A9P8TJV3_WICPI|nr:hypothetical protein WICPIJ_007688 [Wickerhamomyces pijperi]